MGSGEKGSNVAFQDLISKTTLLEQTMRFGDHVSHGLPFGAMSSSGWYSDQEVLSRDRSGPLIPVSFAMFHTRGFIPHLEENVTAHRALRFLKICFL